MKAPQPPSYRAVEMDAEKRCGICEMRDPDTGECWGFANKLVGLADPDFEPPSEAVCDDWEQDPDEDSTDSARGGHLMSDEQTPPLGDEQARELRDAIRAVVHAGPESDAARSGLVSRAQALNATELIPDNWAADGSLKEARDTANDVFATLDGAVSDACDDDYYWTWVQDWYGSGAADDPYTVIYCAGGDLWAATFEYDDQGKVTIDIENARKVRPLTQYVDRSKQRNKALRSRPRLDPELRVVRDGMRGEREVRQMPATGFEMREIPREDGDGSWVVCAGYFSLTCSDLSDDSNAYEMEDAYGPWVESTVRGFATKTIREGCDTAFLVNHSGVTMARTKAGSLDLDERLDGGHYEGRLNPTRPDVQILRAAVQDKAVDESSFAFRVVRQKWSDDYTRRWIQEIDLNKGDVSPVNYGANPHTGGHLSMRSAMALLNARGLTSRALIGALQEIRAGKAISQATLDVLQPILDDLASIDKMVDADQPKLAELLGVSNPDADEDDADDGGDGEDAARSATVLPLLLPDYGAEARAKLARLRG